MLRDYGVTGILLAQQLAFGSGELTKVSIQQYDLGAKGQSYIYLNLSTAHYANILFIFFIEGHILHTDYPQFQITAITL